MHEAAGPVHPAPVDHVSGERGSPAGHGQLLHQLPHLLLRLCPLQEGALQGDVLHFVVEIRWKSRKTRLHLFGESFGVASDAVCFEVRDLTSVEFYTENTSLGTDFEKYTW